MNLIKNQLSNTKSIPTLFRHPLRRRRRHPDLLQRRQMPGRRLQGPQRGQRPPLSNSVLDSRQNRDDARIDEARFRQPAGPVSGRHRQARRRQEGPGKVAGAAQDKELPGGGHRGLGLAVQAGEPDRFE